MSGLAERDLRDPLLSSKALNLVWLGGGATGEAGEEGEEGDARARRLMNLRGGGALALGGGGGGTGVVDAVARHSVCGSPRLRRGCEWGQPRLKRVWQSCSGVGGAGLYRWQPLRTRGRGEVQGRIFLLSQNE